MKSGCALLLLLSTVALHAGDAPQDSSAAVAGQKLPFRSSWESAAAVPGQVLFLPVRIGLEAGKLAARGVWESHLLTRMAAVLTTADGRTGLRPLSNTSLGTGLRLFHRPGAYELELLSTFGRDPGHRRHHVASVSHPAWNGKLSVRAAQRSEPGESFYGVGLGAPRGDRTRYLWRETVVAAAWQARRRQHVTFGTQVGWRRVHVDDARDGSDPSTTLRYQGDDLPGLATADHLDVSVSMRAEFVDLPGSPRHGNITVVNVGLHPDAGGDGLSYTSWRIVTEQFQELFYSRTLSLRAGVDWRAPLGSGQVPFHDLASVGGDLFVRGYQGGRFRDRGALFSSLNYKFPVWKLVDGSLFYEAGRTFSGIDQISLRAWKSSWGGGVRLWVRSGVVFNQWVAFSDEEWRALFSFATDF